jgi:hypothetical protein
MEINKMIFIKEFVIKLTFAFIPTKILHEFGHVLACYIYNVPVYGIVFRFPDFITLHGAPSTELILKFIKYSGGFFAFIVLIPFLLLIKHANSRDIGTEATVFSYSIYSLINGLVEGYYLSQYETNPSIIVPFFIISIIVSYFIYN